MRERDCRPAGPPVARLVVWGRRASAAGGASPGRDSLQGATAMTTGRLGQHTAPPNTAYAGQVVQFPDPIRAARYPRGVQVDEDGYPDFSPYARAAAEIAEPPEGFGVDELRLTDYVS